MLCDEHSSVLDPTCGSGTALRAAESLGASRILGLELNPEHVANARQLLRNSRLLRKASDRVSRVAEPAELDL
jgi:predicted RNA methylase